MRISARTRDRLGALVAAGVAVALVVALPAAAGAAGPGTHPGKSHGVALTDGGLRAAVDAMRHGKPVTAESGVQASGGRVLVEVVSKLPAAQARAIVAAAGGIVTGGVDGVLVEARVPYDKLEALEA